MDIIKVNIPLNNQYKFEFIFLYIVHILEINKITNDEFQTIDITNDYFFIY